MQPTARPRFRTDLVAEPVEEGGHRYIDIVDPDTGNGFRFYDVEYSLACAMDGERDIEGLNRVFADAFTDRYRRDGLVGVRVPQLNPTVWRFALLDAGEGAFLWRDERGEVAAHLLEPARADRVAEVVGVAEGLDGPVVEPLGLAFHDFVREFDERPRAAGDQDQDDQHDVDPPAEPLHQLHEMLPHR